MNRKQAIKRLEELPFSTPGDKSLALSFTNEIFDSLEGSLEDKKLGPWVWVKTEYCAAFKNKNPDKGGHIKESISRMKKMFAANPEIRKEDVMGTVKLYLSETNSRYIRKPHFFLKKGVGANAIYDFSTWFEKYKEQKELGGGRASVTNTMQ